jgi:type I site-specific restriction endonuclease
MNDDEKRFLEQIQKENEAAHAETRQQFQTTTARFEHLHAETRQEFQTTAAELKELFQATSAEIRRHFDTVAEDIAEKTHQEIQLLAESLAHVDHKVDVNSAKIDRLAADNEVFKSAFANVDRRLRIVEDIVLPQKPS